jgi:hypothetical protein
MSSTLKFFSGKVFLYNLERALPPGLDSYRPDRGELIFFFKPEIRDQAVRLIKRYISADTDEKLDEYLSQLTAMGVVANVADNSPDTMKEVAKDAGLEIRLFEDGTYEIEGYTYKGKKPKSLRDHIKEEGEEKVMCSHRFDVSACTICGGPDKKQWE